jgi:hypothetical protein
MNEGLRELVERVIAKTESGQAIWHIREGEQRYYSEYIIYFYKGTLHIEKVSSGMRECYTLTVYGTDNTAVLDNLTVSSFQHKEQPTLLLLKKLYRVARNSYHNVDSVYLKISEEIQNRDKIGL